MSSLPNRRFVSLNLPEETWLKLYLYIKTLKDVRITENFVRPAYGEPDHSGSNGFDM
jgi:hypothetical protein